MRGAWLQLVDCTPLLGTPSAAKRQETIPSNLFR